MLFIGMLLLPIAAYLVGQQVFGDYAGGGFGGFFRQVQGELRAGRGAAWFLVLAPYLGWQLLRLSVHAFRYLGRRSEAASG